jgi:hypothetical protein
VNIAKAGLDDLKEDINESVEQTKTNIGKKSA